MESMCSEVFSRGFIDVDVCLDLGFRTSAVVATSVVCAVKVCTADCEIGPCVQRTCMMISVSLHGEGRLIQFGQLSTMKCCFEHDLRPCSHVYDGSHGHGNCMQ